jgi:hypothetical protein
MRLTPRRGKQDDDDTMRAWISWVRFLASEDPGALSEALAMMFTLHKSRLFVETNKA